MTPKATSHVIQGMQKDTSKSKLSKEFAFDAKNIRITAREGNTLLTITNEKGNKQIKSLFGSYLGHCVLNNQLIIFTTTVLNKDFIFLYDSDFIQTTLYSGALNFSLDNPIEALGVYENEDIQKVYWVDGINQPRVINIKTSEEVRSKWSNTSFDFIPELELKEDVFVEPVSNSSMFAPGVIQYAFSYYNKYGQESNIFNVSPLCYLTHKNRGASPEEIIKDLAFKVKVTNLDTKFDYVRIYSIHRTSLNAAPTVKRVIDLPAIIPEETIDVVETHFSYNIGRINNLYVRRLVELPPNSIDDPNGKLVTDVFKSTTDEVTGITTYEFNEGPPYPYDFIIGDFVDGEFIIEKEISGNLENFKYVETKTSYGNRDTYWYKLEPIRYPATLTIKYTIENTQTPYIEYIDNGTLGNTIDPTQLLYIGGEDIIAGTITQKDNTLFLGNITLNKLSIPQDIKDSIRNTVITPQRRFLDINIEKELFYPSDSTVINEDSYYKAGEHYRVGIQFQHKSGKWSEPVYITDYTIGLNQRPNIFNGELSVPSISYDIDKNISSSLVSQGFKKMRGLVVFPEEHDRKVIAQGILCPTVYNPEDRNNNNPYSQSSWFLRPNLPYSINNNEEDGPFGFNNDKDNVYNGAVVEFRHGHSLITGANRGSEIQNEVEYRIDQSLLTLYSPEVEFENNNINTTNSYIKMRIVGTTDFTSNYGDIDILTKTSTAGNNAAGFIKQKITNINSGETGLISGLFFEDKDVQSSNEESYRYLIYPWHRSSSLNNDSASLATTEKRTQSAILEKKKISNIKFSKYNTWFPHTKIWEALGGNSSTSFANGISKIEKCDSNQVTLIKIQQEEDFINYYPNIDYLATKNTRFGIVSGMEDFDSELEESTKTNSDAVRIKYKSSPHYVFKLNNSTIDNCPVILPCINNINKTESEELVQTVSDIESHLGTLILYKQYNIPSSANVNDLWIDTSYHADVYKADDDDIVIRKRISLSNNNYADWELYAPNEYSDRCYYIISSNAAEVYKPHPKFGSQTYYNKQWKLEAIKNINSSSEGDTSSIKQDNLELNTPIYPYLYLAEIYRDENFIKNAFGGNTEEAIKSNLWLPASRSIPIDEETIVYEYGDTRYQRYDCLKTYAFTPEDENQVIEIASFMCETRVNMLGRYDKNIGNLSNLNADPTNFNLFNPVYSQKDNFFNYRILDSDFYKLDKFNNTITWSKEKHLGEDVDTWTNITMASTLDLDGTKGKVNKLITFKDQIFAFQDKGISNILFNSRVQIPVSDGVPVEISNGMKVDGSRYISDNIGCQNKNSIVTTPSGVYFLDSESNGIYLLADGLTNLSTNKGFDIWTKEVSKDPSFKSFYDKNEKDVYFTTEKYCLGYSEKLGQFTSFYDYTDVETMFNIGTGFYSIKADNGGNQSIYQHSVGNYNEFYGEIKPYHLTIISNEDPQVDKVFTNLDYRADFFDSNNNYLENESFDTLEVWNEYQRGKETLKYSKFRPSNLKKKFRMWGANIPRDKKNKLDRMRNPWLYIKLSKENPGTTKMELHDLVVKYLE
jgi:hypothetical protein